MTTEDRQIVRTYARTDHTFATVCGASRSRHVFIHDGAVWETFSAEDLSNYLIESAPKAAAQLARIADLSLPYTMQDEQEMFSMIESLLHARHAFEDTRSS
jgi:hypothetical protein